ncbi:PREDICTED: uncharacterized protein LOC108364259 [Rhagoletis zephyria]|uniref:uncharacterized protein LOC108364259 n=1 Tax=Rhagoletis zephyria TaxID=28612 RepID=UPI0008115821|nr:PREDICTED: uncharacterized protein LOC108364259 [Rhagoletis zephyria]
MQSSYYDKDNRKYGDVGYEQKYLLDPKYMTKRDMQHYYRYYHSAAKGQRKCRKVIFLVFCVCSVAYLFVDYNLRSKIIQFRDRFEFLARVDADYNVTQAYFVNTPGCHMPYFDVTNYRILQYMGAPPNLTCEKALTSTSEIGSRLWWTMTDEELMHRYKINDTKRIKCHYASLKRNHSLTNSTFEGAVPFKLAYNQSIEISPETEWIRVRCSHSKKKYFYEDYHFFALDKRKPTESIQARSEKISENKRLRNVRNEEKLNVISNANNDGSYEPSEHTQKLSVMLLGIGSVSHLNFLRHMKRTAAYIRKRLDFVEFWGFNKVGDNAYTNLIPLLTGLAADELKLSCMRPRELQYVDDCPFIWKRFKGTGYMTAFLEDVGKTSLFSADTIFKHNPTDYYMRPIVMEMENNIGYYYSVNVDLCMGGRRTVDLVLEMIHKLIPYLQTDDFFSLFWLVSMTHDFIYMPKLLDKDFVSLFERFQASGILNKTIILLLSDQGMRWGSFRRTYQGMMEERQPLLVAIYPSWFKQKYPEAVANLEINSKRLTTSYDVYATILDLLNLNNLRSPELKSRAKELRDADIMPRGISLFLPVPETRTCENAGIASHWCACHQRTEMPTNDGRVQAAARYVVKLINEQLKSYPQCRVLYLNSIQEAVLAAPHHSIARDISNDYAVDITLRLQTKPGLAVFESTVRLLGYTKKLTGIISRLNLYGSQSYCINNSSLKMYCYCHR